MLFQEHLNKEEVRSLLQTLPRLPQVPTTATRWAQAAGMINAEGLTPEGKLVTTYDPYLETTVTDWLLHFHLSEGDRLLRYFVYEFLPQKSTFLFKDLLQSCTPIFTEVSSSEMKKGIQGMLGIYRKAIVKNKFLTKSGTHYTTGNSNLSNTYTTGYLLAKQWEKDRNNQESILINDLISAGFSLIHVLGISSEQLREQLDILAHYEIIEQRSARPHTLGSKPLRAEDSDYTYQVFRNWDNPLELLEKVYENDIASPNRPLTQSLAEILDDEDDSLDISSLLEWTVSLIAFEGGSNMISNLAS